MSEPEELFPELEERERQIEVEAMEEGKKHLLEQLRTSAGDSPVTQSVAGRYWQNLSTEIKKRAEQAKADAQESGAHWDGTEPSQALDAETLAFITVRCLLENLARPRALEATPKDILKDETSDTSPEGALPEVCLFEGIAHACQLAHFSQWLNSRNFDGARKWALSTHSSEAQEERLTALHFWELYQSDGSTFSRENWEALGHMLVDTAKFVGLLEPYKAVRYTEGKRKTPKMVVLSEEAFELINAVPPSYALPMVSRPAAWRGLDEGGYLLRPMSLVKHRENHSIKEVLHQAEQSGNLSVVYKATNALQETPWRINKFVYNVMKEIRTQNQHFPEIPTRDEIRRLIRCGRPRRAREEGKKARVYLKLVDDRLKLANRLLDEKTAFYFPYQLDFRGRAYAVPQLFNPQSDDMGRALLEFAKGKELGDKGNFWLAVHVANMWGRWGDEGDSASIDKQSFEKRVQWVELNQDKFPKTVQDALKENSLWRRAKKPWRFLAACKEWGDYLEQRTDFESHLPIAMDGTCNGFQHLSAMLLDKEGAKATNLLPTQDPSDIYRVVAQKLKEKLRAEAATPKAGELAQKWLEIKIDRDVVKPGTMTTPYGAGKDTKCDQLIEVIEKKGELITCEDAKYLRSLMRRNRTDIKSWLEQMRKTSQRSFVPSLEKIILKSFGEGVIENWLERAARQLAGYLFPLLNKSISDTYKAHGEIEKWLKKVAGKLARENKEIKWRSPTGFPVVQASWVYPRRRAGSKKYKRYLVPDLSKRPDVIDKNAQKRGIVPNFVHSFDAAHMMLTVNALSEKELRDFAVVHDSYAVHACDVDTLREVLRNTFVEIYRNDVLRDFL